MLSHIATLWRSHGTRMSHVTQMTWHTQWISGFTTRHADNLVHTMNESHHHLRMNENPTFQTQKRNPLKRNPLKRNPTLPLYLLRLLICTPRNQRGALACMCVCVHVCILYMYTATTKPTPGYSPKPKRFTLNPQRGSCHINQSQQEYFSFWNSEGRSLDPTSKSLFPMPCTLFLNPRT